MKPLFLSMLRRTAAVGSADLVKSAAGAALAVLAIGAVARLLDARTDLRILALMPSLGASAVLVFAIPASPLAQPRAVIGGNILSAAVGLACALLIPDPLQAAVSAVGLAIAAMLLLGCLHPPGGAVALATAMSAVSPDLTGVAGALMPAATGSLLLVGAAMGYINLTGRSYPHRVKAATSPHATRDAPPSERVGFTPADLDRALAHYGELLDVSREDLDVLFRQVELQAHRRIHSQILCRDIMSKDVISVDVDQSAESALAYLQKHDLRTAPVVDAQGRVVGMARRAELQAGRGKAVGAVLDPFVHKISPDAPIERLLPVLSSGAAHEVMVVDERRILLGVITQTDLLAVLYRAHIVEAVAA
jgi:CBS domain-containing membrane protein